MTTDTTTHLIRLRAAEQKRERTPERRLLISALEIAIVLSGETDRKDAMPAKER